LLCRHGCSHEKDGRNSYALIQQQNHLEFRIDNAGFFVSSDNPYIGATPDGLVDCKCCGRGIVEVKCPFCLKDKTFDQMGSGFCLGQSESGQYFLKKDHQYFYQVQMQLFVTKAKYCDFVVWTSNQFNSTFVQRISADQEFFTASLESARIFYVNAILPELLGKSFTVPRSNAVSVGSPDQLCYCGEGNDGDMLECKSGKCTVKLFHKKCLQFAKERRVPKTWKCPTCTKVIK